MPSSARGPPVRRRTLLQHPAVRVHRAVAHLQGMELPHPLGLIEHQALDGDLPFTLGQAEFSKFHMMVLQGGKTGTK